MAKSIINMGASVRAKLLQLSKTNGKPFDILLTRYVLERFLYRLSTTSHRERFVLKGAMLLTAWIADPHRATRDIDLLGFGSANAEAMLAVIQEICAVPAEDGVAFDAGATVDRVRDELQYGGLRIKTTATIGGARVRVVIDIGFGDAIEPGLTEIELPVLLGMPAPSLRSYARETVIAEKFQAMVMLGRANSRMKDFYDIWLLSQTHEFTGDGLHRAIAATFARRGTAIPAMLPDALTESFAADPSKQRQWESFIDDVDHAPGSLADAARRLKF